MREAISQALESLMFGRMVDAMRQFFTIVGLVTLAPGGIGVMRGSGLGTRYSS